MVAGSAAFASMTLGAAVAPVVGTPEDTVLVPPSVAGADDNPVGKVQLVALWVVHSALDVAGQGLGGTDQLDGVPGTLYEVELGKPGRE